MIDRSRAALVWLGVGSSVLAMGGSPRASAQCPAGTPIDCSTDLAETLLDGASTIDFYACGSPYASLTQPGPERFYTFVCPGDGNLTAELLGINCDLDLYVLGGACDPSGAECRAGSTRANLLPETANVTCIAGETLTFVVEAFGYGVRGDCPRSGASYQLVVDASSPVCVAASCAGCVQVDMCMPGDVVSACGTGGAACESCDDGDACTEDACIGGACTHSLLCTPCVTDADCPADRYCGGEPGCLSKEPLGAPCTRVAVCASGHCIDDVCCASSCTGTCERCDASGICFDDSDCTPDAGAPDAAPPPETDSGVPVDANVAPDTGPPDPPDASLRDAARDAGADAPKSDGGCSCGVEGSRSSDERGRAFWLGAFLLLALCRRARSR